MSVVTPKRAVLELCIGDPAGIAAAAAGGADRLELSAALEVGGLTPSTGFMLQAKRSGIPAMAMIRPRAGGFVYSEDELALMLEDISHVREIGLAGVVFGVSRRDGALDVEALNRLVDAAGPLETCLHRAFDLTPDPFEAVDQAAELGFTRILTSGQQKSVPEGLDLLVELGRRAGERISIMPGGGITLKNVGEVIRSIGISEIHTSCSSIEAAPSPELVRFGFAPAGPRKVVDPEAVGEMRRMLAAIAAPDPVLTADPTQSRLAEVEK